LKKILSLCIALAAFAIAPSADAADMPIRGPQYKYAPAPAPVFNWTGFYVGAHIGYGFSDDADGFTGGFQAGYNWQFSRNIVFGVEADISGTDMNGTPLGLPFHIDYLGTARARLGYTWDRTMVYGTGGFAFSRAALAGLHDTDTGFAIGAGLEWAYSNAWTLKAEYMYYDLGAGFDASMIRLGANYRFSTF
jgi:outer membrane immunogenic protein